MGNVASRTLQLFALASLAFAIGCSDGPPIEEISGNVSSGFSGVYVITNVANRPDMNLSFESDAVRDEVTAEAFTDNRVLVAGYTRSLENADEFVVVSLVAIDEFNQLPGSVPSATGTSEEY